MEIRIHKPTKVNTTLSQMRRKSLNVTGSKQDTMSSVTGEGKKEDVEQSTRVEWTEKGSLLLWIGKQEMDNRKECAHSQLK